MYHGNRILIDHAQRLTEERAARSELLRGLPSEERALRRLFASLPRFGTGAGAARSISFDLETTSG